MREERRKPRKRRRYQTSYTREITCFVNSAAVTNGYSGGTEWRNGRSTLGTGKPTIRSGLLFVIRTTSCSLKFANFEAPRVAMHSGRTAAEEPIYRSNYGNTPIRKGGLVGARSSATGRWIMSSAHAILSIPGRHNGGGRDDGDAGEGGGPFMCAN
ncbi:hypothetical protein KM043_016755 [Ampulex compressa]|nr:hypothetical protein KM043_016755 [Ampulex compressa]